jgi:Amt family ammonium transporter
MVNLTYGILSPNPDGSFTYNELGTDIVSTLNGETSVYDPGDIAWVLCSAVLIIFMVSRRVTCWCDHHTSPPDHHH